MQINFQRMLSISSPVTPSCLAAVQAQQRTASCDRELKDAKLQSGLTHALILCISTAHLLRPGRGRGRGVVQPKGGQIQSQAGSGGRPGHLGQGRHDGAGCPQQVPCAMLRCCQCSLHQLFRIRKLPCAHVKLPTFTGSAGHLMQLTQPGLVFLCCSQKGRRSGSCASPVPCVWKQ